LERRIMAGEARRTKRAPEPLDLVQRFLNTKNLMRGYDLLESPQRATRWLEESGYDPPGTIGGTELARLLGLREGLRDVLLSHNPGASARAAEAASGLNDLIAAAALGVCFDPSGRPLLAPSSVGTEGFVEALLGAAVRASYDGTWRRLKACANEGCRSVFYDASKNRSGTWCVMEICGSRAKMRSYRRRRGSETP
jgi:predicted RNA-binding Zn ribbon-like protein